MAYAICYSYFTTTKPYEFAFSFVRLTSSVYPKSDKEKTFLRVLEASPVDSCLVRGSIIETSGLWAVLAGINLRP